MLLICDMCLMLDAEFRLCNPVVLQRTMFRRVLGEQRGYAAEISHDHMSCHKHGLVGHSWVGLGPILSYRCRGVISS